MIQKSIPHAIVDRQALTVSLDGEELPYFYAEQGPRTEELGEGLSILWLPVIADGVEEIPADEPKSPFRSKDLWPEPEPAVYTDVVTKGGRVLRSYRGDS
ncbi:hypothetical protein [Arthrobacter sp. B2a2-09]|uniref:hypothetical protein n=1 Tax=Arthrobacter sp. B2a2-09 TaxID=2952822 RepID=UPI0022CDB366|nr:hypothetical protein [Arthrobacter sp. B2a2-09]MCZ9884620.1 hypothetical protein [Arthrobacter sp. B2a2-09]